MAKKRMYSFAEKKHSQRGLVSTILGGLSLVIFGALAYLAYYLGVYGNDRADRRRIFRNGADFGIG